MSLQDISSSKSPGNAVGNVKFDPHDDWRFFCARMDGYVAHYDLETLQLVGKYLPIPPEKMYTQWHVSLDVTPQFLLAGDTQGNVVLLPHNTREMAWSKRLHKGKVHSIGVCKQDTNVFATCSVDHSVCVWDVRYVSAHLDVPKQELKPLATLKHDVAVNVASFSPSGSRCLLTSDQLGEVRFYQAPGFNLVSTVRHPHRQFQHLTPIQASWHPMVDVAVIGRYPEAGSSDPRSIDFIDSTSSSIPCCLPGVDKITSLSKFNLDGSLVASAAGNSLTFWEFVDVETNRSPTAVPMDPFDVDQDENKAPRKRRARASQAAAKLKAT